MHYLIDAGQTIANQLRRYEKIARAHGRQRALGRVNRARHRHEIDDPGAAFQCVKGTEGAVEPVAIVRRLLERQEVVRRLLGQLARFQKELFEELVHGRRPHSMATCSVSSLSVSGLIK